MIQSTNTYIVILPSQQHTAYNALLDVARRDGGVARPHQAQTLAQLIQECWGWRVSTEQRSGSIHALAYEGDSPKGEEQLMLTLAPFVSPGGFLVAFTERLVREQHFDGRRLITLEYKQAMPSKGIDPLPARTQALTRLKRRARNVVRPHMAIVPQFRADHYEARTWLAENNNASCFASNAFRSKSTTLDYIERLYQLGAKQVCVTHVFDRLYDILCHGGPYADAFAIELPDSPIQANDVTEFCKWHSPGEHCSILTHASGFWEDMIPEGWVGIRWD